MKKIFAAVALVCLVLTSFCQSRTAIFQGRTVKVFPYRIQVESYSDHDFDNLRMDKLAVPYCPEKLEDGEYIIYFKPEIDLNDDRSIERFAKGDTIYVAINYSIKNGIKDGPVFFYDINKQQKPSGTGFYINDKKNGVWKSNNWEGSTTVSFKDDILDGKIEIKLKEKKQRITGFFKDGKLSGRIEFYEGKKLVGFTNFKTGSPFGSYYESKNLFNDGSSKSKSIIKGFSLREGFDSITQFYTLKNKLLQSCLNSFTPFKGSDTTEMDWYMDTDKFNLRLEKILNKSVGYSTSAYENIFTNCYEISDKGKRINDIYLINKKIKIPFVYLNANGDTILITERIEKTADHIKFKVIRISYYKNHKVYSKEESHVTKLLKQNYLSEGYLSSDVYSITYGNRIYETFSNVNRPVAGYQGFIIKKDSTNTIDKKTLQLLYYSEKYEINELTTSFSVMKYKSDTGNDNYTYPDITYNLKGVDTLEVIEKEIIDKNLYQTFTKKLCMKDTNIIWGGNENLINPYAITRGYTYSNSFIGKSGHQLYYLNRPYTGTLYVDYKFSKKIKYYYSRVKLKEKNKALYLTQTIYKERAIKKVWKKLKKVFKKNWRNDYDFRGIDREPIDYEFNYKNGKLNGYQAAYGNDEPIYELNFKNGISHGVQKYCINKTSVSSLSYGDILSKINYDSGQLHGYAVLNNSSDNPGLVAKYDKGHLIGRYIEFEDDNRSSEPQPSLEANFKNDTLTGDLITYYSGIEKERIPFVNGEATGDYYKSRIQRIDAEQSDSVHHYESYTKIYKELKIKLNKGVIADTAFAYFEDGSIKYMAVMDTGFHHKYIISGKAEVYKTTDYKMDSTLFAELYTEMAGLYDVDSTAMAMAAVYAMIESTHNEQPAREYINFGINNFGIDKSLDLDPLYDKPEASFTFYYKNGLKSQQGKMANNTKYRTWKYWNENGVLMKEIEYKTGTDSSTMHKIYYKGKIKGYYPSGKKMYDGLITDEEFSYQCSQEIDVSYEEVFFLNFINEAGDSVLIKQSGPVTDFHLNGNKRFVGQITNGLRTGLWRFYDPTGNLNAIGEYADGYKQGKWLEGDLGGINYLDNACSVNEALSLMKERQQQDIDVSETLYEMGEEISRSHLVLEKF